MAFEVVKSFPGSTSIGFTEGRFDRWCVQERVFFWTRRPTDADCFARLMELAQRYGRDRVMADFVAVYDAMGVRPPRGDLLPSEQVWTSSPGSPPPMTPPLGTAYGRTGSSPPST